MKPIPSPAIVFREFEPHKDNIQLENISDAKSFDVKVVDFTDYTSIEDKWLWETLILFERIDIFDGKTKLQIPCKIQHMGKVELQGMEMMMHLIFKDEKLMKVTYKDENGREYISGAAIQMIHNLERHRFEMKINTKFFGRVYTPWQKFKDEREKSKKEREFYKWVKEFRKKAAIK
jgi:hypothetical protein